MTQRSPGFSFPRGALHPYVGAVPDSREGPGESNVPGALGITHVRHARNYRQFVDDRVSSGLVATESFYASLKARRVGKLASSAQG